MYLHGSNFLKIGVPGWPSQIKHLTPGFGSSHHLKLLGSSPELDSTLSTASASDSLPLLMCTCAVSFSLLTSFWNQLGYLED